MSADFWLETDLGGPQPAEVTERRNVPDNVLCALRLLTSGGFNPDGLRADLAARYLRGIRECLRTASLDTPVVRVGMPLLDALIEDCEAYPRATVRVL